MNVYTFKFIYMCTKKNVESTASSHTHTYDVWHIRMFILLSIVLIQGSILYYLLTYDSK